MKKGGSTPFIVSLSLAVVLSFALISSFALAPLSFAAVSWEPKGPTGVGVTISNILIDGKTGRIYAFSRKPSEQGNYFDYFVYLSTNEGASWDQINQFSLYEIFDIKMSQNDTSRFYMGGARSVWSDDDAMFVSQGGVFKNTSSLEAAGDWIHETPNFNKIYSSIGISTGSHEYVYAGAEPNSAGIGAVALIANTFETTGSWETHINNIPPFSAGITAIAVSPKDPKRILFNARIRAWTDSTEGLYLSTDEGFSFTQTLTVEQGQQVEEIGSIIIRQGIYPTGEVNAYAIKINRFSPELFGGIFKSTDEGNSWVSGTIPSACLPLRNVAVPEKKFNKIYACGGVSGSKVYRSSDFGVNWTQVNGFVNTLPNDSFISIAADPNDTNGNTVYVGTALNGIYKTVNGGSEWYQMNEGIGSARIRSLEIMKRSTPNIFIANSSTPANFYKSSNFANTWTHMANIYVLSLLAFDQTTTYEVYAKGRTTSTQGLLKSIDGGMNWDSINANIGLVTSESLSFITVSEANRALYVQTTAFTNYLSLPDAHLYKSTDEGQTFVALSGSTGTSETASVVAPAPGSAEVIYKGRNLDELWAIKASTDEGVTFIDKTPLGMKFVNDISVDPTDAKIVYAACGNASGSRALWKSINGGETWTDITPIDLTSGYAKNVVVSPSRPSIIYLSAIAGTSTGVGVWKSPDGGVNWSKISEGASGTLKDSIPVVTLDVDPFAFPLVYAGTNNGVYKGFIDAVPPSAESISPARGSGYRETHVTISGDLFINLHSVYLNRPGNPDLVLSIESYSTISIEAIVPPSTIAGTFEVVVDGDFGTSSNGPSYEVYLQAMNGPIISRVKFDGRTYSLNAPISRSPLVMGIATDEDGVSPESFSLQFFNLTYGTPKIVSAPQTESPSTELPFTYEVGVAEPQLSDGDYFLRIVANDLSYEASSYGNEGLWEGYVKVYSGKVEVIGLAMVYPVPFKALGTERLRIGYTLNQDAPVTIFIYDVSGQVVLTRKYGAGAVGGHAGYNMVDWNGRTDFGRPIGNGLYIGKIVSGNRIIATIKIPVLD